MEFAPDSSYRNETLCASLCHTVVRNKPRSVLIVSNNFGIWPMNRALKFARVGAIASIQIVWASGAIMKARAADSNYELKPISLPGARGAVALDYFAYDRATGKLWVPASNTGSVDVIDDKSDAVSNITGFPTGEIERRGKKITVGPTAASVGDGVVYIGNRGNAGLCVIDAKTFTSGECVPVSPDRGVTPYGMIYVTATHEVWITTRPTLGADPAAAKSLQAVDASNPRRLKWKSKIPLDGLAEGYAVDNDRGLFYTNIEDADATVSVDVQTHEIIAQRI